MGPDIWTEPDSTILLPGFFGPNNIADDDSKFEENTFPDSSGNPVTRQGISVDGNGVTVEPGLQTAVGDDTYNDLSPEDQQKYVSVGESLWIMSSAIVKLVQRGLIESIGMIPEEESDDYIMIGESQWVSKLALYQLFYEFVNPAGEE
ncbi:MAG: hypothetical protein P9L98_04405 [Candidatus Kaelpia imicola]|nr:hypothetical protein [Candidatus Kaelpia imicola]